MLHAATHLDFLRQQVAQHAPCVIADHDEQQSEVTYITPSSFEDAAQVHLTSQSLQLWNPLGVLPIIPNGAPIAPVQRWQGRASVQSASCAGCRRGACCGGRRRCGQKQQNDPQGLCADTPSRPPRGRGHAHRLLPVQQHRAGRPLRAAAPRLPQGAGTTAVCFHYGCHGSTMFSL